MMFAKLAHPPVDTFVARWLALLALCAAYLQRGLVKAFDFSGAIAEVNHFGLSPAMPLVIVTIAPPAYWRRASRI